jgi:hypothetical protein
MADIVNVITKATNSFLDINTITVDNWTFKLFYKWTVTILIAGSGGFQSLAVHKSGDNVFEIFSPEKIGEEII